MVCKPLSFTSNLLSVFQMFKKISRSFLYSLTLNYIKNKVSKDMKKHEQPKSQTKRRKCYLEKKRKF